MLPQARIWGWLLLLLLSASYPMQASQAAYQVGKLVDFSDRKIDVGGPFPLHLSYLLLIQCDDFLYSVLIDKRTYHLEWVVGNSISFRIDRQKVVIRKLDGKELKARLVSMTPLPATSPLLKIPSRPLLKEGHPIRNTPNDRWATMGIDFLRSANICVGIAPFANFGGHSDHQSLPAESGSRAARIRLLLGLASCSEGSVAFLSRPELSFNDDFAQSVQFDGFWKSGFATRKAALHLLTEAQVRPRSPFPDDTTWWEYELELNRDNIGDAHAFVLQLLTADGIRIDRFSVRF